MSVFDAVLVPPALLSWLPVGQPAAIVALLSIAALIGRTLWKPDADVKTVLSGVCSKINPLLSK